MRANLSRVNIVATQLKEMTNPAPKGFLASIFGSKPKNRTEYLQIRLSRYDALRTETWIEDLCEVTRQNLSLTIVDIVALLYSDFLRQVRRGAPSSTMIAKLKEKQQSYLQSAVIQNDLQQVALNHWALKEVVVQPKKEKQVMIEIEFPYRAIARGEVFLLDLHNIDPTFNMTVEQLITILILDFINEIKKGNDIRVFQKFLENLGENGYE